jgi:CubicO group peptidase (beta-lactamase class C family)
MRALVFALSLLAVAAPSARAEEPVLIRPAQPADPQAALAAAMEGRAVPAMGVLVIRNGRVASETVRGVRRLGQDAPAAAGDLWHLGSDTKPMTATLVVLLAEEAKLSWTARLDQMLPELADEMRPEYRDVTLADLLSHRSGLPENAADEAAILAGYDDPRPLPEQRLDYVRRALTEAPVAPARGEKHYSNTGFILAAVIAERAMGRSYEALMTERVFAPLGMTTATFSEAGEGELTGHVDGA